MGDPAKGVQLGSGGGDWQALAMSESPFSKLRSRVVRALTIFIVETRIVQFDACRAERAPEDSKICRDNEP